MADPLVDAINPTKPTPKVKKEKVEKPKHENPIKETVFNTYDEQGKVIGQVTVAGNPKADTLVGKTVYDAGNGNYTLDATKAKTSISFDDNTGKITIKAPEAVLKSKAYKESIPDKSFLSQVSALYKADHNTKFIDPYSNDKDKSKDITLPDLVKKMNDGLQKVSEQVANQQIVIDKIREQHGDVADRLTEDDMIIMSTQYNKDENNTSRQAIPLRFKTMFEAAGAKVADDGTVLGKDFLDTAWNTDKVGRDQILGVKKLVEDYFREGDFSDANEYARMVSFEKFISENGAKGFHGQEYLEAPYTGAAKSLGELALVPLSLGETVTKVGIRKVGEFLDATIGGGGSEIQDTLRSTGFYDKDGVFSRLGDTLEENADKKIKELETIDRGAGALAKVTEMAVDIAGLIVPAVKVSKAAKAATPKYIERATEAVNKIDDIVNVAKEAGKSSDDFIKVVKDTINGADDIANVIEIGSQALLNNAKVSDAVNIAKKSVDILKKRQGAIAEVSDIVASSMVDAAITDPAVMRDLISGDSDDYQYVLEQFAWNAGGFATFWGGGKILEAAASSKPIQVADAVVAKFANMPIVGAGELSNKIKTKVLGDDWIKNIRNAGKRQVAELNQEVRLARKAVASERIFTGGSSFAESIARQRENLVNLRAVENAKTDLQRGARGWIRSLIHKSDTIGDLDNKLGGLTKKILETEKAMGISPGRQSTLARFLRRGNATEPPRIFSVASANYRGAVTEINVLENIRVANKGKLTPEQLKGLKQLRAQRDSALKVIGKNSDLRKLLDEYLSLEGEWWHEFSNIKVNDGILSEEDLAKRVKSGIFNNEDEYIYRSTPRSKEFSEYSITRRNGTVSQKRDEIYTYQWGSDDDFLDPLIARYNAMEASGIEYNLNNFYDTMQRVKGFHARTVVSAQDVRRVDTITKLENKFNKTVKSGLRSMNDTALKKDRLAFGSEYDKRWKSAISKAENDALLAGMRADKAKDVTLEKIKDKVRPIDRKNAILGMDDKAVDNMLSKKGMSWGEISNEAEFAKMIDAADKKTKDKLKEAISRVGKSENGTAVLETGSSKTSGKKATRKRKKTGNKKLEEKKKLRITDITYDDFKNAIELEDDLLGNLNKSMASGIKEIRDSEEVFEAALEVRRNDYIVKAQTSNKKAIKKLQDLQALGTSDKNIVAFYSDLDSVIDDFLYFMEKDKASNEVVDQLIKGTNTASEDDARQFLLLRQIQKNSDTLSKMTDHSFETLARDLTKSGEPLSESEIKDVVKNLKDSLDNRLQDRIDDARRVLSDEGSTLVNNADTMKEIKNLRKEIKGAKEEENIIPIRDESGGISYVETDPITADLIKYKPAYDSVSSVAQMLNTSAKLFRLGTTGVNLTSMVNQTFRDSIDMFIRGGGWRLGQQVADNLTDEFGDRLVDDLKRFEPETFERLTKESAESGEDMARLVVNRELALGKSASSNATETAAYRLQRGMVDSVSLKEAGAIKKLNSKIDNVADTLGKPNEVLRERVLRNIAYENAFYDAIKGGYNIEQSRIIARHIMDNATTNFSTQMYHLRSLQKTIPYLGAAVNGTKSFWRLWSVSPISITTRFIGGAIIPVMGLTGAALMNPKTREEYRQLKEYEKDANIIFPVGGKLYKIPAPQELAPMVAPFRQFVENLYDVNRHDFWELMLNDAIGLSPIDFDGFVDIDRNRFAEDPGLLGRLWSGAQGVLSQIMPPPVKTGFILATGIDPYTGQEVDTSRWMFDEETNQSYLMDSSHSAFAQWFTNSFGQSGSVAAKVISTLFGTAGLDTIDTLTRQITYLTNSQDLLGDNFDKADNALTGLLLPTGDTIAKAGFKPLTISDYNRTKRDFTANINRLYEDRDSILDSEKYRKLENQIAQEQDPEKRQKLITERNNLLQPFHEKVANMLKRYVEQEGEGAFDQYRSAAVVALLNPYARRGAATRGNTAEERETAKEEYLRGQRAAMDTLTRMGANPQGTASMLGYITTDWEGNSVTKFFTPYEILNAEDMFYKNIGTEGSPSLITGLIGEELNKSTGGQESLRKQKSAIKNQIRAMYGKGKLSKSDYKDIDRIRLDWNAKVIAAIDPYIQRVGVNLVLKDDNAINLLKNYILVPSEYEKVKGRYVSSGNGVFDKQSGFIESYLKEIYGVK